MKEEKTFIQTLKETIDVIRIVSEHHDYDWIRKYGNIYLKTAINGLEKAMKLNPPFDNTTDND